MKRGFTLVELSIVLVIIGLLIGGILVAQSMISTAKTQSVIREIQQYDAAINNFETKYNGLPGDAVAFGGNGDGEISSYPDSTAYVYFQGEIANFWPNLQQSGFSYSGTFSNSNNPFTEALPTPSVPTLRSYTQAGVLVASVNFADMGYGSGFRKIYQIGQFTNFDTVNDIYYSPDIKPVFTVTEAAAIDLKIDDGNPAIGYVQNGLFGMSGSASYFNLNPSCDNYLTFTGTIDSVVYNFDAHGPVCYMSINLRQEQKLPAPNTA